MPYFFASSLRKKSSLGNFLLFTDLIINFTFSFEKAIEKAFKIESGFLRSKLLE